LLIKQLFTAGSLDATTGLGLEGERAADGSLIAEHIKSKAFPVLTPDKPKSPYTDIPPYEKSIQTMEVPEVNERPGWKLPHQFDREPVVQGNYWSADFEDEHWNTPTGVSEAYSIWGRPVGTRSREYWR